MSTASRNVDAGDRDRAARLRPWTAAILTALLHLLLLLLVLLSPPVEFTAPEGGAAGSALQVTYIDNSTEPPPPPAVTPVPRKVTPTPRPRTAKPVATRIQVTRVERATDPVPPDAPTAAVDDTADAAPPQAPAADPTPPTPRSSTMWGQPPGMLPENVAPVNAGPARSAAAGRGRRNDASAGGDMEVGGYQVYYDLIGEIRLRAWRDQGMTELSLPLPGTRKYMVCPLEVALRRGSGACRLVEPDSPELKTIGDARLVINMQRVYKLGEEVWNGPGAYR